jgi:RNA polymerase sigma factor (TIGR02999 family)
MKNAVKKRADDIDAPQEVMRILVDRDLDGSEATNALIPLVYNELRSIAEYRLAQEPPEQTLQPTDLVNETYLRLVRDSEAHWENKRHFFAAAAEAMRRILIDEARRKNCQKRGGDWRRTEMDVCEIGCDCPKDEIEQIHEVLDQFEEVDPESAELVKLRFFAGLTQQQCADILGISKRTADNRWAYARAWLYRAIVSEDR